MALWKYIFDPLFADDIWLFRRSLSFLIVWPIYHLFVIVLVTL